jgi:hypothetical protein
MRHLTKIGVVVFVFLGLAGCESDPSTGQGRIKMYLTDGPLGIDAVNIVVREVAVHSATEGWLVVNDSVRTFNLLALANGAMTLLGDARLNAGQYTQIRLILDAGSNVVVDGITHPLNIPSGFETGVKLNHQFTLQADFTYELVLDFDAARSISQLGNTLYQMKPVIRVQPLALSGAITGSVVPPNAKVMVTAIAGTDTASTYADTTSGWFKLVALPPASYSVSLEPEDAAYRDTTIAGVQVAAGQTTSMGTVSLPAN